jgi:PAS domain S-box-containing protein
MLAEGYLARRRSDQRWRIAFENSAIGIMLADFGGRFFSANSAFLNMLGYEESELYQLTFIDITYEEDRKQNLDLMNELVDGRRQHFEIEKRYYRKDGSLVWARTNYARVPGNGGVAPFWFAIVENITERKCIEEGLRESETRLQTFFENSPNLIFLKDRHGRYLYVNKEFTRAFCISTEQITGRRDEDIFSAQQSAVFCANDRHVFKAGVPMEFEEIALQADGPHTGIVHKFPLFNASGEIYAIGGIVTDITERKRAEQALQTAQADLARISRLTTMGELAASIAHEVNQPLTAITNNCNACLRLLADDNLEPHVLRRVLEEIVADSIRAGAVITRIRTFLEKGSVERNEVDLNELIEEVLAMANRELSENQVSLERNLAKSLPKVLGDRIQLQQVLLNLIRNGIEAMTAVMTRPRTLSVQSRMHESENTLVSVSDTGTGVGLDADWIFSPFFTTKATGMGLGLPISRSLIEAHGGRLWVGPNSPHGAVFYFTVPVAAGGPS